MTEQTPSAESVAARLAERNIILGTVECATDGIVSHHLFETDQGPAVLGDSLAVETVEDAIDLLALPDQQFKSTGSFSGKAARAAARAALEFLGVDWCLVVWAEPVPAAGGMVQETVYLALNTGNDILEDVLRYDGPADGMGGWLVGQALGLVWRALS